MLCCPKAAVFASARAGGGKERNGAGKTQNNAAGGIIYWGLGLGDQNLKSRRTIGPWNLPESVH